MSCSRLSSPPTSLITTVVSPTGAGSGWEAVIALTVEQGAEFFLGHATAMRGWVRALQGESNEGTEEIRRGMESYVVGPAQSWNDPTG